MSLNKKFTNTLAALTTIALLFAVAVGVEAQSEDPILDDDIVCSIQVGGDVWVARVNQKSALENHFGEAATVETLGQLVGRLPTAGSTNSVRFEGGAPSSDVRMDLADLGYETLGTANPEIPGAASAYTFTA